MLDQAFGQSRRPGPDVPFLTLSPSPSLIERFSSCDSYTLALPDWHGIFLFYFGARVRFLWYLLPSAVTSVLNFFEIFKWLLVE